MMLDGVCMWQDRSGDFRIVLPVRNQQRIETGKIAENPQFGDGSAVKPKQRGTEPLDRFAGWRVSSKRPYMPSCEPHLRKRLMSFGNAGKNLTAVIGQRSANRTDVILEGVVPVHLGPQ
jgi:hypothetical protein